MSIPSSEAFDLFDIFVTGEIFAVTTKSLKNQEISRLIMVQIMIGNKDIPMTWEFDFASPPEGDENVYLSSKNSKKNVKENLENGKEKDGVDEEMKEGSQEVGSEGRERMVSQSGFHKIYLDFLYGKYPVFFGFQKGTDGCHLFVGKIGDSGIDKICYQKNFLKAQYVDSVVFDSNLCVLDAEMNLKVLKIETKK